MKYIFFGTPRFASIVLERLFAANMAPVAVVCNPDRPIGRKHVITPPPVKVATVHHSPEIDIIQPEAFDETFHHRLTALEPDFFVVAAYAKIIPQNVLDIARLGTLGTHPSLLPKYRGASPIQSAILHSETETGVSIYLMDQKMDHGPILAERSIAMDPYSETYPILEERLATLAGDLLVETMPQFFAGDLQGKPQDHTAVTFTKKFSTADGFIPYADLLGAQEGNAELARTLVSKIHALAHEPGCWTLRVIDHGEHIGKSETRIKILEASLSPDGFLKIEAIQEEGQKPKKIDGL